MTTIKSYTDLEQSTKLAEILPTESADMEYLLEQWVDEKTGHHKEGYCEIPVVKVDDNSPLQQITHPCWSLAALLNVLFFPVLRYDIEDSEGGWIVSCENNDKAHLSYYRDNPVDTCYEMIIHLHKLNLL